MGNTQNKKDVRNGRPNLLILNGAPGMIRTCVFETVTIKSKVSTLLVSLIFLGAISCGQHKQPVVEKTQSHPATEFASQASGSVNASSATILQPQKGYVPDEQTAIAIAVAVWTPIYGREQIEKREAVFGLLRALYLKAAMVVRRSQKFPKSMIVS